MAYRPGAWIVIRRSVRDWWDSWLPCFILGLIFVVSWLTVLLGPPATFTLIYASYQVVHEGQELNVRALPGIAWKYAGVSWLWMLINLVVTYFFFVNLNFYLTFVSPLREAALLFYLVLILIWWSTNFFALPYFFELERKNLLAAYRNGFSTMLAFPGFSLLVCGLGLILAVASILLVAPLLLGIPPLLAFLSVRAVDDRLIAFGIREPEISPQELEKKNPDAPIK